MAREVTSINELERLLQRQKERVKLLRKRRDRLVSQIARTDKQIESLLGKPPLRRRVRRGKRGAKSLQQFIVDVLKESPQPRTAAEIAEAVTQGGYRSKSKNLTSLVRQVCYKSNLIQTKERGKFAAAGASGPPRRRRKRKKAVAEKK